MSGKFMMNGIEYLGGGSGGGGGNVDDVYVNGESVLDENKIAQVTSYKEVTLAEYMALPDTKLTDGVMYCIKDIGGANQFPPLIYSDEEREVGVWRDGKPLYQRTFIGTCPNHTGQTIVQTLNEEILAKNISGYIEYTQGNSIFIPNYESSTWKVIFSISTVNGVSTLRIEVGSDLFNKPFYVTLQYTKTTDTPGSGTWTTDGTYAHHYSTSEKVIGTWIDGKPLYEKSYVTSQFSGGYDIATDIPFDGAFVVSGYYLLNDSNGSMIGLNEWFASANYSFCHVEKATKKIRCYLMGYTGIGYFTIQYTKTTD